MVISNGISALDLKAISDRTFDLDSVNPTMVLFASANDELATLIQRRELPLLQSVTPPNHTMVPVNPKFSGESTASDESGVSAESKAENHTDEFANRFVEASIESVRRQLGEISWIDSKLGVMKSR